MTTPHLTSTPLLAEVENRPSTLYIHGKAPSCPNFSPQLPSSPSQLPPPLTLLRSTLTSILTFILIYQKAQSSLIIWTLTPFWPVHSFSDPTPHPFLKPFYCAVTQKQISYMFNFFSQHSHQLLPLTTTWLSLSTGLPHRLAQGHLFSLLLPLISYQQMKIKQVSSNFSPPQPGRQLSLPSFQCHVLRLALLVTVIHWSRPLLSIS